jgi:hypothetical protein
MSTYDDASLVLVPSGYKNGIVFSQKPMDANGQLTFTRASSATRVQSDGLIEKVRTNLALYSEDQTNWTVQNQTNVTANAAANPLNGAVTADKVIPTVVTDDHYRGLTMATMVGEITASIYVKADGYSFFDFGIFSNTASNYPVRAIFNLSTQAITYVNGSVASITSVGSGWYRVSITGSVASSSSIGLYHRVKASTTTGTYSGDNTSGMLLWGCQLESGVMTDYIGPTTTAAVSVGPVSGLPRLDYLNSTCPKLLLEPQRTNLFNFSEQLDNAYWSAIGSLTITANTNVSPDGSTNADRVTTTAAPARIQRAFTGLTAGTRTLSCFVKAGTGAQFRINTYDGIVDKGATFNVATGSVISTGTGVTATITNYGNGWYRVTHNYTSAGTTYSCQFFFDNVGTYEVYGFQFEDLVAYATSYIPTLGASVTRVADAASKTGISSLIGQTDGTIFVDCDLSSITQERRLITISNGTESQRLFIWTLSNLLYFTSNGQSISLGAPPLGTAKIAVGYTISGGSTTYSIKVNNNTLVTGTLAAAPTPLNAIHVGSSTVPALTLSDRVNQTLLFKTRLSNAALQELTTL